MKKQQEDAKSLQGPLQITDFLQTAQQIVVKERETDNYTVHWSYKCLSFLLVFISINMHCLIFLIFMGILIKEHH